jgi:hypothetical protein
MITEEKLRSVQWYILHQHYRIPGKCNVLIGSKSAPMYVQVRRECLRDKVAKRWTIQMLIAIITKTLSQRLIVSHFLKQLSIFLEGALQLAFLTMP